MKLANINFGSLRLFPREKIVASHSKDEDEKYGQKLLNEIIWSIIVIFFIKALAPKFIPFGLWEFWTCKGNVYDWLNTGWPLLAWGAFLATVISIFTYNDPKANRNAEGVLVGGFITSTIAGVFEELIFRWLLFLGAIPGIRLVNIIFLGFPHFFFSYFVGPVADFTTAGYLTSWLFHPIGWYIGAAIISANSLFRDGHKYQGLFGFTNSWFGGMALFYIMFKHGIMASITIHFLYDFVIYIIRYLDHAIERAQGRV